jgi:hypothetical protein
MWDDPIVDEVRSTRERLAEKFGFDVHAIFADLRERQAKLGARLVRRGKKPQAEQPAEPGRGSDALRPGR